MNQSSASYLSASVFGDAIPVPEVIEDDHATGWLLWDESVNQSDFPHAMRYAATGPAPLCAMG